MDTPAATCPEAGEGRLRQAGKNRPPGAVTRAAHVRVPREDRGGWNTYKDVIGIGDGNGRNSSAALHGEQLAGCT
ncbi:hypothetical protein [Streptomyces lateritius]|uniref:hypothetical protein n=1 Tax=Streptomyces lateritius TaxID=67313 RepID=UPI00167A47F6|nr:hypothetical protein [Streptomyces lateritius]GGU01881.1 hypothetical protein GCM10010272_53740 [Streptomyces lateritius]